MSFDLRYTCIFNLNRTDAVPCNVQDIVVLLVVQCSFLVKTKPAAAAIIYFICLRHPVSVHDTFDKHVKAFGILRYSVRLLLANVPQLIRIWPVVAY